MSRPLFYPHGQDYKGPCILHDNLADSTTQGKQYLQHPCFLFSQMCHLSGLLILPVFLGSAGSITPHHQTGGNSQPHARAS